jgi:hypothetical protein
MKSAFSIQNICGFERSAGRDVDEVISTVTASQSVSRGVGLLVITLRLGGFGRPGLGVS